MPSQHAPSTDLQELRDSLVAIERCVQRAEFDRAAAQASEFDRKLHLYAQARAPGNADQTMIAAAERAARLVELRADLRSVMGRLESAKTAAMQAKARFHSGRAAVAAYRSGGTGGRIDR